MSNVPWLLDVLVPGVVSNSLFCTGAFLDLTRTNALVMVGAADSLIALRMTLGTE
jgi:hypothetical protein